MKLKQFFSSLLVCSLIATSFGAFVNAEDATVSSEKTIGITINDSKMTFQNSPIIINDRVLVPVRSILEYLGAKVGYDDSDKMAVGTKGKSSVILFADSTEAYINEVKTVLDTAPTIIDDSMYVPVRVVAEGLSCEVEWDGENSIVKITSYGAGGKFVPNDGPETFETAPCTADTFVKNGDSSKTNFGTSELLEYKATNEDNYARKVFLKFDISKLTDSNITNAKIMLYCDDGENLSAKTTISAYDVPDNWQESTINWDNSPELGALIGTGYAMDKTYHQIDISQYMRDKVAEGAKSISLCVFDTKLGNKRLNFYSREKGSNPPYLNIKYGGSEDIVATPEPLPNFEADPLEVAKQVLERSKAQYSKVYTPNEKGYIEVSNNEYDFLPSGDAYVRNDEYADESFGSESVLCSKSAGTDKGMSRRIFMKYDLSGLAQNSVGGAFLKLKCTLLQDATVQNSTIVRVSDTSWDENSITWNNAPKTSDKITATKVTAQGGDVYYDITSFVNSELAAGRKVISFSVEDVENQNVRLEFGSKESNNSPKIMMMSPGAVGGSVVMPSDGTPDNSSIKYIDVGVNRNKKPFTDYTPTKTRIIKSLTDYTPVKTAPELSIYGGLLSTQHEATGYFYTKKIDDRWWMIDPLGHQMVNVGLVAVSPGNTPRELAGLKSKYGTQEKWADEFTKYLRDDLGFNGAGAWSNCDLMKNATQPFPYCPIYNFITGYADELGTSVQQSGHKGFVNDTMPVFDPGFIDYCDKTAKREFEKYKDDPYCIGFFSDNEMPCSDNMLDNYLKLDNSDELNKYSYTTAWEWFKARHGENASVSDIAGNDRDDFREFVFDRYYDVVTEAIKKYDPNHMYLGCRYWNNAKTSEGMWRAAGRYCDAVSLNYYSSWDPSRPQMKQWEEWSGKPLIVTEWYTKGMDSGLGNNSGAGWIVATQKERGYFYQNFAMGLLESGTCVGWHWFKYHDNDPTAPASDPSNTDGNKGIINPDFKEYTDLTAQMKEFNKNIYSLIEYFDAKK